MAVPGASCRVTNATASRVPDAHPSCLLDTARQWTAATGERLGDESGMTGPRLVLHGALGTALNTCIASRLPAGPTTTGPRATATTSTQTPPPAAAKRHQQGQLAPARCWLAAGGAAVHHASRRLVKAARQHGGQLWVEEWAIPRPR